MIAALVPAGVLRILTTLAYRPALWFIGDSTGYVQGANHLKPDAWRPVGYTLMLLLLRPLHSLPAVVIVQHLLGLMIGLACYVLARRLGAPRWLATVAALPVLYDGYMIAIEQSLLSETLFTAILMASLLLLLWRRLARPSLAMCLLIGLLLSFAALTRPVGIPVAFFAAVLLAVRKVGLGRLAALLAAFTLPLLLYATWFDRYYQEFALSLTGRQLYGHVMRIADCARLPHTEVDRFLCRPVPRGQRHSENWYAWSASSPVHLLPGDVTSTDLAARDFAVRVIEREPLAYAHEVWDDLVAYFSPETSPYYWYRFSKRYPRLPPAATFAGKAYQGGGDVSTHVSATLAPALHAYQSVIYVRGPLLFGLLLVSLAGWLFGLDRTRGGLTGVVALLSVSALALLIVSALMVPVEERYRLPPLPLLSVSACLGVTLLIWRIQDHRYKSRRRAEPA